MIEPHISYLIIKDFIRKECSHHFEGMQVSSLNPDFSKILIWKAMLPERHPLGTLTWVAYKS